MTQVTVDTRRVIRDRPGITPRQITLGLLAIGAALRTVAFAAGTPLFLDEILLSKNILDLPLAALLTEPLGLDQVAPRGFLVMERLSVLTFGPSERALRLVPFLCGIAGLFLFWQLAERTLSGTAATIAVGLVALGVPFLRFGAEVKQYIVDAGAATLLMLIALHLRREDSSAGRLLAAGIAGFVISWFSQTSALVMAAVGVSFAVTWVLERDRRSRRVLLFTMPVWGAASLLAVVLGEWSMTPSTRLFMQQFWASGFFPLPFDGWSDVLWFWNAGLSVFSEPALLRYRWAPLFVVLALAGVASLWTKDRFAALLVLTPMLVVMSAAVAQRYPFLGRLLLFLVPSTLLAVAAGIDAVRRLAARLHPAAGVVAAAVCLVPPVLAIGRTPPPYHVEPSDAAITFIRKHLQPGDTVVVWPISRISLLYYGPRLGITPDMWTTLPCDRDDVRAYLRSMDRYRGTKRLWVYGMNARVFMPARSSTSRYLNAIGHKRDSLVLPAMGFSGLEVELYDLSDAEKLKAADAETFPIVPFDPRARPGCRPWVHPDAPLAVR